MKSLCNIHQNHWTNGWCIAWAECWLLRRHNECDGRYQITSLAIAYSAVYSGADQRKHQSSASLAFVPAIHRSPVNSPHKGPVTRKMFRFDDVIKWYDAKEAECHCDGLNRFSKLIWKNPICCCDFIYSNGWYPIQQCNYGNLYITNTISPRTCSLPSALIGQSYTTCL